MTDGELRITPKCERELVITREFNAPRKLVFDAYTKPELIRRWLTGMDGWSFDVCEVDLRVGGKYRWVWKRDSDGFLMGMGGVYREISPPARLVCTEKFDQAWYPGEAICTLTLVERSGRTTLTQTMTYESPEALKAVLDSPMESGLKAGMDRLEGVLKTLE
ncbi:MAG: SRPBCC family protein [Planctomycetes bacterium]|nr:SRPBCC family protein [Planctomycetota bacterium]